MNNKYIGLVALIISVVALVFAIIANIPDYKYETRLITLENTNYGTHEEVVDYLCDEGVITNNCRHLNKLTGTQTYFYASTWTDADIHSGQCLIKIRNEEKQ